MSIQPAAAGSLREAPSAVRSSRGASAECRSGAFVLTPVGLKISKLPKGLVECDERQHPPEL